MSFYLTGPLVAGVGAATKAFAEFDDELQKMVGLAGVSQKAIGGIRKELLGMAGDVGKGPRELASGLYFINSAGVHGAKAMNLLRESSKAAASGLGEVNVVADALTSALNAYQQQGLGAKEATDQLSAAVKYGKGEADAFAPALGVVVAVASQAKIEFSEVAAAMATMTRLGFSAARSATSLRSIIATVQDPSDKVTEGLKKIGLTALEARNMYAEDFFGALMEIRRRLEERGLVPAKVFNSLRALPGFLAITGDAAKSNAKVFEGVTNSQGQNAKAFEAIQRSAGYQIRQLGASIEATAIRIGQRVGQFIKPVADFFGSMADAITSASDSTLDLGLKLAAVAAGAGPALWGFGLLLSAATALTTPLGLVAGLIGSIGAALGILNARSGIFKRNNEGMGANIKEVLSDALEYVREQATEFMGDLMAQITRAARSLFSDFRETGRTILDFFKNMWDSSKNIVATLVQMGKTVMPGILWVARGIMNTIEKIYGFLDSWIVPVGTFLVMMKTLWSLSNSIAAIWTQKIPAAMAAGSKSIQGGGLYQFVTRGRGNRMGGMTATTAEAQTIGLNRQLATVTAELGVFQGVMAQLIGMLEAAVAALQQFTTATVQGTVAERGETAAETAGIGASFAGNSWTLPARGMPGWAGAGTAATTTATRFAPAMSTVAAGGAAAATGTGLGASLMSLATPLAIMGVISIGTSLWAKHQQTIAEDNNAIRDNTQLWYDSKTSIKEQTEQMRRDIAQGGHTADLAARKWKRFRHELNTDLREARNRLFIPGPGGLKSVGLPGNRGMASPEQLAQAAIKYGIPLPPSLDKQFSSAAEKKDLESRLDANLRAMEEGMLTTQQLQQYLEENARIREQIAGIQRRQILSGSVEPNKADKFPGFAVKQADIMNFLASKRDDEVIDEPQQAQIEGLIAGVAKMQGNFKGISFEAIKLAVRAGNVDDAIESLSKTFTRAKDRLRDNIKSILDGKKAYKAFGKVLLENGEMSRGQRRSLAGLIEVMRINKIRMSENTKAVVVQAIKNGDWEKATKKLRREIHFLNDDEKKRIRQTKEWKHLLDTMPKQFALEIKADVENARDSIRTFFGDLEGHQLNVAVKAHLPGAQPGRRHTGGAVVYGMGEVPAILEKGEFVVRKSAVQKFKPLLEKINTYHDGGYVGQKKMGTDVKFDMSDLSKAVGRGIQNVTNDAAANSGGKFGNDVVQVAKAILRMNMGFRITEHPKFDSSMGAHSANSYHYRGRAIDLNWGAPGQSPAEQARLDWLGRKLKRGLGSFKELFYPAHDPYGGHQDHLHLAMHTGGMVGGLSARQRHKIRIDALIKGLQNAGVGTGGKGDVPPTNPEGILALGKSMAAGYGWKGSNWRSLYNLWMKESNWNPRAVNPDSGATGIPQLNPNFHTVPRNWSNPRVQIGWGLNYINGRYGNPNAAWAHSEKVGWYGRGAVTNGPSIAGVGEAGREAIIPLERYAGRAALTNAFEDSTGNLKNTLENLVNALADRDDDRPIIVEMDGDRVGQIQRKKEIMRRAW